ncbi:hypothetical protein B0I00_1768 [Novosphingobium kunmingense]|uniref:VanZ family protein n=2 Tax=Novosphingobium kunmingense TaxID=1211806 RepID=A0A2N0HKS3_9SPHN|nr:hypothetical protein B0I00_1768 [Novosphingobium kunmingense]
MPPERTARALRILFWLLLATALYFALDPRPPRGPLDRLGDKWEHMIAFATLTFVAVLAWPRRSVWRIAVLLAGFGALIELLQAYPAIHRDSDWRDFVADCVAIALTALTIRPLVNRFAKGRALP